MKTKIILLVLSFMLSIMSINAQINLPKNNKISNVKLKKNQYKELKLITGGNQGYAYDKKSTKKIPNVEIIFKSEDGKTTQKIKTNKYGYYKIRLKPGRYTVTTKHLSYQPYTTGSGFSIINNTFRPSNIPLQKLLKYPIKNKGYNIIAVFNTKTKKMIDIVFLNSNNKRGLQKRPNTAMFYGRLTSTQKTLKNSRKEFSKGNSLVVYLNKKYIPGDQFLPGDQFILRDQFIPGDQFLLFNTKFKILSKTKEQLRIVAL